MEKKNLKKMVKTTADGQTNQSSDYNAMQRCRAVLAVWTDRQRPAQVCRELSIPQAMLRHWQSRALEGMLQALEPQVKLVKGTALSPRLQVMLERQQQMLEHRRCRTSRLQARLDRIQAARKAMKK